jgi:hypothetical protein
MSTNAKIVIVLAALCWVALSSAWHWIRSKYILEKWAKANGFKLLRMKQNWFTISPFLTSKRQETFRISVRDHRGRERKGWAKCGGFFLGFLVDKVEVEWD